jgi:hypothetical protein
LDIAAESHWILRYAANELMPITVRLQPSEVERVVPNALFDCAIGKRLEDKSLHPRYRAKQFIHAFQASLAAAC